MLKKIGGVSAGIAGFSSVTTATEEDRRRATEAPPSRRLLEELNEPKILRATTQKLGRPKSVTGIVLHTEVGRLVYVTGKNGQRGVQFHLDPKTDRASPDHEVPERYDDVPADGSGVLVADKQNAIDDDTDISFLRDVSASERRQLASVTGITPENARMFYSSPVDGFEVHVTDETATNDGVRADNREVYFVRPDANGELAQADVERVSASDVETTLNDCETWADRCLSTITVCTACAGVCISVPFSNIPGVIVCITCIMGCHGVVPYACGKVIQNCG